ncbi:MAG: hypothetical protein LBS36_04320 [Oscillospiraceae bacterium]|nr:hypothetical protein [Oscillospiraceae bacterium]
MKKFILYMALITSCMFLQFIGCNDLTPEEAKEVYLDNTEAFHQAIEICGKYEFVYPISQWKLKLSDEEAEQLSKEELKILKKLAKSGVMNMSFNENRTFFAMPRNSATYQGVIVISSHAEEKDAETLIRNNYAFEQYVEIEQLDDDAYYYFAWGGLPAD